MDSNTSFAMNRSAEDNPLRRIIKHALRLLGRDPEERVIVSSAMIHGDRAEVYFQDGAMVEFRKFFFD